MYLFQRILVSLKEIIKEVTKKIEKISLETEDQSMQIENN